MQGVRAGTCRLRICGSGNGLRQVWPQQRPDRAQSSSVLQHMSRMAKRHRSTQRPTPTPPAQSGHVTRRLTGCLQLQRVYQKHLLLLTASRGVPSSLSVDLGSIWTHGKRCLRVQRGRPQLRSDSTGSLRMSASPQSPARAFSTHASGVCLGIRASEVLGPTLREYSSGTVPSSTSSAVPREQTMRCQSEDRWRESERLVGAAAVKSSASGAPEEPLARGATVRSALDVPQRESSCSEGRPNSRLRRPHRKHTIPRCPESSVIKPVLLEASPPSGH